MNTNNELPGARKTMISYESTTTMLHLETPVCALVQDLLPLYIEGEVTPSSRDVIAQHLTQCERCSGFLAGAQSVRSQLRREKNDVTRVLAADKPAQHAVQTYQQIAKFAAMIVVAPIGLVIAGRLWDNLPWTGQQVAALGPLLAFGTLLLAFGRRGRLSTTNIVMLGVATFAGCLGVLSLLGGNNQAPFFFSAVMFIVGSLAMIWSIIARPHSS